MRRSTQTEAPAASKSRSRSSIEIRTRSDVFRSNAQAVIDAHFVHPTRTNHASQLLTTGVDAPTCKNVVLARVVGSMSEFKQIIGRGTRVRDDYGKLWFNIIDYTGS